VKLLVSMAIGLACGFVFARYTADDHAFELSVMRMQHEHALQLAALRLKECRWAANLWRDTAQDLAVRK
jgi:hypothetical protein